MSVISKKLNVKKIIQSFHTDAFKNHFKSLNNYWVFCDFKAEDPENKDEIKYIKLYSRFFDCTIYISSEEDAYSTIINSMNKEKTVNDFFLCNEADDKIIVQIAQQYLFEYLNETNQFEEFMEKQKESARERGILKGKNHVRTLFRNEMKEL